MRLDVLLALALAPSFLLAPTRADACSVPEEFSAVFEVAPRDGTTMPADARARLRIGDDRQMPFDEDGVVHDPVLLRDGEVVEVEVELEWGSEAEWTMVPVEPLEVGAVYEITFPDLPQSWIDEGLMPVAFTAAEPGTGGSPEAPTVLVDDVRNTGLQPGFPTLCGGGDHHEHEVDYTVTTASAHESGLAQVRIFSVPSSWDGDASELQFPIRTVTALEESTSTMWRRTVGPGTANTDACLVAVVEDAWGVSSDPSELSCRAPVASCSSVGALDLDAPGLALLLLVVPAVLRRR